MKDNRDPKLLGEKIFAHRSPNTRKADLRLSQIIDYMPLNVPDYRDESTIEKYGDPRLIPSTLPN